MRVPNAKVVVAGLGQWGPFSDGRTIRYADLVDGDGGGVIRASYAQDYNGDGLAPMLAGTVDVDYHVNQDGKLKCRLHGFKAAAVAAGRAA